MAVEPRGAHLPPPAHTSQGVWIVAAGKAPGDQGKFPLFRLSVLNFGSLRGGQIHGIKIRKLRFAKKFQKSKEGENT